MRFGFVVPYADSREFAELAALGEQHGWDAVFTWEAVYGVDAWVSLAAAALATERIRLGTLLTPVPRIKPWDLATRVGTVDRLSNGRVVLGAGLGALHEGWTAYEADEGRKVRAREARRGPGGLRRAARRAAVRVHTASTTAPSPTRSCCPTRRCSSRIRRSGWSGRRSSAATKQPSLARAARWQGLIPVWADPDNPNDGNSGVTGPERMAAIVDDVRRLREEQGLPWEGYDVVLEADSTGEFVKTELHPPDVWAEVGVTWWVESWWGLPTGRRRTGRAATPDRGRPGRADRLDDAPGHGVRVRPRRHAGAVQGGDQRRRPRRCSSSCCATSTSASSPAAPTRSSSTSSIGAPRRASRLVAAAPDADVAVPAHYRLVGRASGRRRTPRCCAERAGVAVTAALERCARDLGLWEDRRLGRADRGPRIADHLLRARPAGALWNAKRAWDPDGVKTGRGCATPSSRLFPELEVRSGGSTSVDVTRARHRQGVRHRPVPRAARRRTRRSSSSSATGSTRAATTTR